jgi:GMP synthase (glutamine-hydrolysing)
VPIIEEMLARGQVIEPLAELYKVEVRELGARLEIPREALRRHPFPGPGLGVRLLCSKGDERVSGELSPAVGSPAARFGLEAVVLPARSVGVKADLRCYEHPVMLTGAAEWGRLLEASGTLLKEVPGINRCVWNLSARAPTQVTPLAATMTRERLDLLREADHLVMEGLRHHGLYESIWQCPTVLVPLSIDDGGELCVVRPIHSERAMTATAARLPEPLLTELRERVLELPGIGGVALDLTSKPPGTIEWE